MFSVSVIHHGPFLVKRNFWLSDQSLHHSCLSFSPWTYSTVSIIPREESSLRSKLATSALLSRFPTTGPQWWVSCLCAVPIRLVLQQSWTLQHLLAPYGRLLPDEQAKGEILAQTQASVLVPTSTDTSSKRYLVFSTFYTASVTFPFAVSIAYWLVLYPSDPVVDSGGKGRTLHRFVLISITVLNSGIALVEITVLSSIRKQKGLTAQVAGIIAIYLLYAMWTVFGRFVTGEYVYKFFDPDYAGWRGVATTDIVILSLTVTVLFAQRGLHTLREILAWKAERDPSGC